MISIPIVFATNDAYAFACYVAVYSVKKAQTKGEVYDIFILHNGLSDENIEMLESLREERFSVKCIDMFQYVHKTDLRRVSYPSIETFYRLFIDEVIDEYEKIIYLDSDIIVRKNLSELYLTDIGNAVIAAVYDIRSIVVDRHNCDIGITDGIHTINAGVIVINLKEFKRQKIREKCIKLLQEDYKNAVWKYVLADQDALNLVLHGKFHILDGHWNVLWNYVDDLNGITPRYRKEYQELLKDPWILHYSSQKKPWNQPQMPMADQFWQLAYEAIRGTNYVCAPVSFLRANAYNDHAAEVWQNKESQDDILEKYRIPFDSISVNDRIILYGAGRIGRAVHDLLSRIHYSEILFWTDAKPDNNPMRALLTDKNEVLERCNSADKVLIAMANKDDVLKAREEFVQKGVDISKISTMEKKKQTNDEHDKSVDGCIRIGLFLKLWALGDQIVGLKIYHAICDMIPACSIDIYSKKKHFSEAVFRGQPNLGDIIEGEPDEAVWQSYDIFLEISAQILLRHLNSGRIKGYSTEIFRRFLIHNEYQTNRFVDGIESNYIDSVILKRAWLQKRNRFTSYNDSGLFDIRDSNVHILMDPAYDSAYRSLGLGEKYITFNYGANGVEKGGQSQIKMWPAEYHAELNGLLKKAFPDLSIVQIGGGAFQKIEGADRYCFGEHLEVVKYILSNACFHFDCEGGLVHLATQLGTKCFVLFGPTPVWYYGYDQNVNIPPKVCGECMGAGKSWFDCYLYDQPRCMHSIKPREVFMLMRNYLNSEQRF